MTAAVVVAAGEGSRLETRRRKQFVELAGRPIVGWSLGTLAEHDAVDEVIAVLPADVAEDPPGWILRRADAVAVGGSTRTASVRRGVDAADGGADTLLVHDGVRPFVDPPLVSRVAEAASAGAVVPVLRLVDTVKEVDGSGRVVRTPNRDRLRRVQTPQGFPAELIRRVLDRADAEGWTGTDEASLCERAGEPVRTVRGSRRNLKITVPADLEYARWWATRRGEGGR